MATSEIRQLFSNFTSIPYVYLLMSKVTNYTHTLEICLFHYIEDTVKSLRRTAISRKVVRKSARDNPERYCG